MTIQFIGCGKMGSVILENIINSSVDKKNIFVKTSNIESENKLIKLYGIKGGIDISSNIVFLCIKPNNFFDIDLSGFSKNTLFISIIAGVTISSISNKIKSEKIIRCMPNTPMSIGKGVIGYIYSNNIEDKNLSFFEKIFSKTGEIIKLNNEDDIDKITSLSGSGPAYFYYITEIIKNKALDLGFTEDNSQKIANSTFIGAASLLEKSNLSVETLRKNITSKGGTTQKAIETFEKNNIKSNIFEAIDSAYNRAKELNKN